jgi:Diacylglycerol acyltransferase
MVEVKAPNSKKPSSLRWFVGMIMASCFSMVYFVAPFYMISAIVVMFQVGTHPWVWLYVAPILVSAVLPPMAMPRVLKLLSPMLDYFEYEEIYETSPVNVAKDIASGKKNYLCVFQPHGALSYAGILSAVKGSIPEFQGKLPTAVADAIMYTPILKHVLGIFGLISASKQSMKRTLKKKGVDGTIVLYVGGMAELFLSCEVEERLYLKNRKGFIKLALTEGVDVVPVYLFGNTTVLSVLKTGVLASISRKVRVLIESIERDCDCCGRTVDLTQSLTKHC